VLITLIVVGSIELLDMGDTGVGNTHRGDRPRRPGGPRARLALKGGSGLGRCSSIAPRVLGRPLA
jgi:hypothetical protein